MGFVGLLLQLATIGLAGYLGYITDPKTAAQYLPVLLLCPLGLILGRAMRRSAESTSRTGGGLIEKAGSLVSGYLVGLVIIALCFGAGFALAHVLDLRPAEGTGRY